MSPWHGPQPGAAEPTAWSDGEGEEREERERPGTGSVASLAFEKTRRELHFSTVSEYAPPLFRG